MALPSPDIYNLETSARTISDASDEPVTPKDIIEWAEKNLITISVELSAEPAIHVQLNYEEIASYQLGNCSVPIDPGFDPSPQKLTGTYDLPIEVSLPYFRWHRINYDVFQQNLRRDTDGVPCVSDEAGNFYLIGFTSESPIYPHIFDMRIRANELQRFIAEHSDPKTPTNSSSQQQSNQPPDESIQQLQERERSSLLKTIGLLTKALIDKVPSQDIGTIDNPNFSGVERLLSQYRPVDTSFISERNIRQKISDGFKSLDS